MLALAAALLVVAAVSPACASTTRHDANEPACSLSHPHTPGYNETFWGVAMSERNDGQHLYLMLGSYLDLRLDHPSVGRWEPDRLRVSPAILARVADEPPDSDRGVALFITPRAVGSMSLTLPCTGEARPWHMTVSVGNASDSTSRSQFDDDTETLTIPASDLAPPRADDPADADLPTAQYDVIGGSHLVVHLPGRPSTTWGAPIVHDITKAMTFTGQTVDRHGRITLRFDTTPNPIGFEGDITVPCTGSGCHPITINVFHSNDDALD